MLISIFKQVLSLSISGVLKNRKYFAFSLVAAVAVIVVMGIFLLAGAVDGEGKNASFEIYLVKGMTLEEVTTTNIDEIPLEDTPLITHKDIIAYNWENHSLKAFAKDAGFHIVDADYDLFKDTTAKPKLVLPAHTDMKNMEEVISNCILVINRRAYRMGEKALEAHKIYRTEEKDGIINAYIQVSFHWFGFENGIFTVVSGVRGQPVRMQLKKQENGAYEVLEYKQAMDGGMWIESVREMFPEDLAELIIQGDDKTRQELWDMQVLKAQKYLEEINRTEAPVMSYVAKERADVKAARAIYLVTAMRPEFPDWQGTREILVRTGGKYPGINVRGLLETECISAGEDQHTVTLTRTWNIKINGLQPVSYWKYRVTGERVELMEEHDNDDMIRIIK